MPSSDGVVRVVGPAAKLVRSLLSTYVSSTTLRAATTATERVGCFVVGLLGRSVCLAVLLLVFLTGGPQPASNISPNRQL